MRVKTEAKREAILEVASQVFLEAGYERASMGEISARLGGSKGTLYSYFASKEALFIAVTLQAGRHHVDSVFAALQSGVGKLQSRLQRFGEGYTQIILGAEFMSARRTVIAEAGRSDIGRQFYEAGPRQGQERLSAVLQAAMEAGELRHSDPAIATRQLIALLGAETMDECLFGLKSSFTAPQTRRLVQRAVSAFMAVHGAHATNAEAPPASAAASTDQTGAGLRSKKR